MMKVRILFSRTIKCLLSVLLIATAILFSANTASALYNAKNTYLDANFGEKYSENWNFKYGPDLWGDALFKEKFGVYTANWGETKDSYSDFNVDGYFEDSPDGRTAHLSYEGLKVTREVNLPPGDATHFSITYTLKNDNSGDVLQDVRFFEVVDYDIVIQAGSYGWYSASTDSVWQNNDEYFRNGFGGDKPSSNHGMEYWDVEINKDWSDGELNGNDSYPEEGTDDVAVGMQWNVGDLDPGDSWDIVITFEFGESAGIYAYAGSDQIVGVGSQVVLNASRSESVGRIVSYEWDINGDGVYETNMAGPVYTYEGWSEPSEHNVTLRVTDDSGRSSISTVTITVVESPYPYPVMIVTMDQLMEWLKEYWRTPDLFEDASAPEVNLIPYSGTPSTTTPSTITPASGTSFSLLDYLSYNPVERNQGNICGNCWQWTANGIMEISLAYTKGIKDRFSVQYLNSNLGSQACCGSWIGTAAEFYAGSGKAIPWNNTNGFWMDSNSQCRTTAVAPGSISTTSNYPINSITPWRLLTQSIEKEEAINRIKTALHGGRAVFFGFSLPDQAAWGNFNDFWRNAPESAVWRPDIACGRPYISGEGGAHAVLIVGYDETDPNNRYWIVLNSWGTTPGRPTGLFRVSMDMDYNCQYSGAGEYAFVFETLDIVYGNVVPLSTNNQQTTTVIPQVETNIDQEISNLSDPSPEVRINSIEILITIGDTRSVEPLIQAFSDDNSTVRARAVWAFVIVFYDARAVDPLIKALGDKDAKVRDNARQALEKIKDREDADPDVKRKAEEALEGMRGNVSVSKELNASMKLQVPLYMDPNSNWDKVAEAASRLPVTVIINPNNGPGGDPTTEYLDGIKRLHDAGVKVLGYVYTSYGSRNSDDVKNDINLYEPFGVDGIFLDQASSEQGKIEYYKLLRDYIKSKFRSGLVFLNPGIDADEAYTSSSVGDTLGTFEDTWTNWQSYEPDSYIREYDSNRFSSFVYAAPDEAAMRSSIDLALSRGIGHIYVTDQEPSDLWTRLPGYWDAEVEYIMESRINETPPIELDVELIKVLGNKSSWKLSVAFSPDGQTLASGSSDYTIELRNITSGAEIRTLVGHSGWVHSVAFSPDGQTLASGSFDDTIKLWNISSGTEIRTLEGHSKYVLSIAFSPDGQTLASGSSDNTTILWNVVSGTKIRTLEGHSWRVNSVAFSSDGRTLASGSEDNTIKLWNVASGTEIRTLEGHSGPVNSVAFSPDGQTLASASNENKIILWDIVSGTAVKTFSTGMIADNIAFSPNGRTLALAGHFDTAIELWNVASGTEIRTLEGHAGNVFSVAFSPDGLTLASGYSNGIKLWNVISGAEIQTLSGGGHSDVVDCVAFSPDGQTLASGSWDGTIKLWNVASGTEIRTLESNSSAESGGGQIYNIAYSPNGHTLASGDNDNPKTIKLWDVASGTEIRTLEGHSPVVRSIAFSPNGRTLASGGSDKTIKLWDVPSRSEIRTLEGHSGGVNSIAFSPDGQTLASVSTDKTVKLWDVVSGSEIRTLEGHSEGVDCVAFSPDGQTLASGSSDHTIKLWNAASGSEIRTLVGHSGAVDCVAFSPDGRILASGGDNIILWDVASGAEIKTLEGHSMWVDSVAFSPDGQTLASGSSDYTIRLWRIKAKDDVTSQGDSPIKEASVTILTSSKILPRSGGLLKATSNDSELDGVTLDIPPFAINQTVNVTLGTKADLPEDSPFGQAPVGKLISIEPSGQTFNEPATLTLPIPSSEETQGLYIGVWNEERGIWENLGGTIDGNFISANVTHLSLYGLFYSGKSTVKIVNQQQLDTTDTPITVVYIDGPVPPDGTANQSQFRATRPLPPGGIELTRSVSKTMELLPGRYHFVVGYPRPSPSVANSMWFTVPVLTQGADDGQVDQTITITDSGATSTDPATASTMIFSGRTVSGTTNFRPAIDINATVPLGVPRYPSSGPGPAVTPPGVSALETGTNAALNLGPIKIEQLGSGITLSARLTDPEGSSLKYYWTIRDSVSGKNIVDSGTASSGSTLTYKFSTSQAGIYTIYLTVYDNYGLFNEGHWIINVVPNARPFVDVIVDDRVIGFGRLDDLRRNNGIGPATGLPPNHPMLPNIIFGLPASPIPDWGVYDRPIAMGAVSALKGLTVQPDHINPDQNPDGMTTVYAIVADADQDNITAQFVLPEPIFGRGNFYTAIPIPNQSNPVSGAIKLSDGSTLAGAFPAGYPAGAIIDNYKVMDAYNAVLSEYANRGWLPSQPRGPDVPVTIDAEPGDVTILEPVTKEFPYVIGFAGGIEEIYPGDEVTEAPLGGVTPAGTVYKVILTDGSWSQKNAKGYLMMVPATNFWDWRNGGGAASLLVGGALKATVSYVGQALPIIWEAPDDPCYDQQCHDAAEAGDTQLPRGGTINIEARVKDPFGPQERDFGLVAYNTKAEGALTDQGFLVGTGDVQVTLEWSANADIDLHVVDPSGEEIYYNNKNASSGGYLDIDNRCSEFYLGKPENVYWKGKAPAGTYKVSVKYYADCSSPSSTGPVSWTVTTLVSGEKKSYSGTLNAVGDTQEVTTFEVSDKSLN